MVSHGSKQKMTFVVGNHESKHEDLDTDWVLTDLPIEVDDDPIPSEIEPCSPPPNFQQCKRIPKRKRFEDSITTFEDLPLPVKKKRPKTSEYCGVFWDGTTRKWKAQMYNKKEKFYLGLYADEKRAAAAVNWMCHALGIPCTNPKVTMQVPKPTWTHLLDKQMKATKNVSTLDLLMKLRAQKLIPSAKKNAKTFIYTQKQHPKRSLARPLRKKVKSKLVVSTGFVQQEVTAQAVGPYKISVALNESYVKRVADADLQTVTYSGLNIFSTWNHAKPDVSLIDTDFSTWNHAKETCYDVLDFACAWVDSLQQQKEGILAAFDDEIANDNLPLEFDSSPLP